MALKIFILAFGLTLVFCLLALKIFPAIGLLDKPMRYGLKRKPLPYPGGIAMLFAFILTVAIFIEVDRLVAFLLVGGTLLSCVSFIDDRKGLSPYVRLFAQVISAVFLVAGGIGIASITNPFGGSIVLDSFSITFDFFDFPVSLVILSSILTIAWVLVMVNAFNWIDGVPGMANSVASVSALVLLTLSTRHGFHSTDQTLAIALSSVILGISLGHLLFDFPPPRIIMGDTGSMLLGFLLAVTAIISGGKIATTILVLGFPILDFGWVIGRRILSGQSPFKGDLKHFHHRLLKAGYSERNIVIFFAVTAFVFGVLALLLQTEGKFFAFLAIFAVMVLLGGMLYFRQEER